MRTHLNILLLIFLGHQAICATIDSTRQNRKFHIGILVSPDYSYRVTTSTGGFTDIVNSLMDESDKPKVGLSIGSIIRIKLTANLNLTSGLLISNKGFKNKQENLTYGSMIDQRNGFVYSNNTSDLPSGAVFRFNHMYLDVPIAASYSINISDKSKIHFALGCALNCWLTNIKYGKLIYSGGKKTRSWTKYPYSDRQINLSPQLGLSYETSICKNYILQVGPEYRRQIFSTNNAPISNYFWTLGLNTVFLFK